MTANDLLLKLLQMKLDDVDLNKLEVVSKCKVYSSTGPANEVTFYIEEVLIQNVWNQLQLF